MLKCNGTRDANALALLRSDATVMRTRRMFIHNTPTRKRTHVHTWSLPVGPCLGAPAAPRTVRRCLV